MRHNRETHFLRITCYTFLLTLSSLLTAGTLRPSRNFQLAVARKMLGRIDDRNEVSLSEQRQAFSSLKAIKAGKRVGSVRTGHRVRDYMPGAVPQQMVPSMNQAHKPQAAIQIYQVRGEIRCCASRRVCS